MKTEVSKWGNSLAVRIPRSVAEDTGLTDRAAVELSVEDGSVVLRPLTEEGGRLDLDALVRSITPANRHEPTEWGEPAGRETW